MKANKREVRELAAKLYARFAVVAPITKANERGVDMFILAALEHAERFYVLADAWLDGDNAENGNE
jgi:hypothetical protein